jgi:hypothetical protein
MPAAEEDSEDESMGSDDAPVAEAQRTPPKAPRFSPVPNDGGLGFMPRVSSYPSTPKAAGVSTLLQVLQDVPVPQAVFLSPFPQDRNQTARRSFGGSQPNEASKKSLAYDDSADEEEESDAVAPTFGNAFSKAKKVLRPTSAQLKAEESRSNREASRQRDTPTVSRARSRLMKEEEPETGAIAEESDSSSSSTPSRARRVSNASSDAKKGGYIYPSSSPVPWVAAALLLLILAQLLALALSVPAQGDVLALKDAFSSVSAKVNAAAAQYVRPYLGNLSARIPQLDLSFLTTACSCNWLAIPAVYVLAGIVTHHGFALGARDVAGLTTDGVERTITAQHRYARAVFVATNAFVSALSFWLFYLASETYPDVAAKPGQPAPIVFSFDWAKVFIIITSFSWALTEVLVFSSSFSQSHLALWIPVLLASEAAFLKLLPVSVLAWAPPMVQPWMAKGIALIPVGVTSTAMTLPLFIIQVAESIKGVGGVAFKPIGKLLLWSSIVDYLYGLSFTFKSLVDVTGAYWLEAVIFLAAVGAVSAWQVLKDRKQLQVQKAQ